MEHDDPGVFNVTRLANREPERMRIRWYFELLLFFVVVTGLNLIYQLPSFAVAKQSTMTVQLSSGTLSAEIVSSPSGVFGESSEATVSIGTDNFTGYSLLVNSSGGTSLTSTNGGEVESISSTVTRENFASDSAYNNKWGLKPSQYISTSGNVDTIVPNSDYLPAPSGSGLLLAKTTTANTVGSDDKIVPDNYTLCFGARIGVLPAGTYQGTYVITAVANSIVYNITYDENTSETVASMPQTNPQALEIDGGTPTEESYGTLSNAVPIMTTGDPIMTFGGWCDVETTINPVTHNYECSGTIYYPDDEYPIDQTTDGTNITLYAIWISDTFPTVWSQMGKCIFDGAEDTNNGYISGSECSDHSTEKFIDTGIALYSNDNYQKDYEVHFTIDRYVYGEQPDSQSTMFNEIGRAHV